MRDDDVLLPPVGIDPVLTGNVIRLDEEDADFDRQYPQPVRELSDIHWTPARVARRAVELLELDAASRVLDVGSGAGKFCLVGASHSEATFVGVERRRPLVEVAESVGRFLRLANATFLHGDAFGLDWSEYDALYFYNPFGEHALGEDERMDDFDRAVLLTQERLAHMPAGARVALYHGFGGGMPASWVPAVREWCGTGILEVWKKEAGG